MYESYAYDAAAQSSSTPLPVAMWTWVIILLIGFYHAYMQYRIAQITGPSDQAWWAFIPVMNTLLLIKMACKPLSWFFLLLIPFVNVVVFFLLWYRAAENSGKSGFWGILVMLFPLSMIALFVLAFGNRPYQYPEMWTPETPNSGPNRPRTPSGVA